MSSPVRRRGLSSPATAITFAAVSAIALLMSIPSSASAQTSTEPVLYACYVPLTGTVYRIKAPGAPEACMKKKGRDINEHNSMRDHVEFSFSPSTAAAREGPAGPMGPVGPMGPAGPQGEVGPIGPAGPQGDAGPTGAVGPQGGVGPIGPQGAQGTQGNVGPMGAVGPQGNVGPMGAQGPQGVQGIPGVSGYEVVTRAVSIAAGATQPWVTNCPAPKKPLGGGYTSTDMNGVNMLVSKNGPFAGSGSFGWVVELKNPSTASASFSLYAVCAVVL